MISDRVRCTLVCGLGTMHLRGSFDSLQSRWCFHPRHSFAFVGQFSFEFRDGVSGNGGISADSFNGSDNERGPQRRRHTLTLDMSDLVVVEEEEDFIVVEIEESVVEASVDREARLLTGDFSLSQSVE
jgi:hypothetical protein